MTCFYCGTELPAGAMFCGECGRPVNTKGGRGPKSSGRGAAARVAPSVEVPAPVEVPAAEPLAAELPVEPAAALPVEAPAADAPAAELAPEAVVEPEPLEPRAEAFTEEAASTEADAVSEAEAVTEEAASTEADAEPQPVAEAESVPEPEPQPDPEPAVAPEPEAVAVEPAPTFVAEPLVEPAARPAESFPAVAVQPTLIAEPVPVVEVAVAAVPTPVPGPTSSAVPAPAGADPRPVPAAHDATAAAERCAQCGAPLSPADIFCPECGFVRQRSSARSRPGDTNILDPFPWGLPRPAEPVVTHHHPAVGFEPEQPPRPSAPEPAPRPFAENADISETRLVPRGPRGERFVLQFSTGESVSVSGSGLIGRNPVAEPGEYFDALVAIVDPGRSVSKTHLEFGQDGTSFWVSDRYSGNGTVVREPDREPRRCEAGKRYRVARGARVEIGEQFFIVS